MIPFINQILRYITYLVLLFVYAANTLAEEEWPVSMPPPTSEETQVCILCHKNYTPGIVEDWLKSRHSKNTPEMARKKSPIERRISSEVIPDALQSTVVGCYEFHSLNASAHKDNFEHFGFRINVIVSPNDCKTCHSVEVDQYSVSKKAHALENLQQNPFDETIERLWIKQFFFYANSVRYASAMGGHGFTTFKNGAWELTINLHEMLKLSQNQK